MTLLVVVVAAISLAQGGSSSATGRAGCAAAGGTAPVAAPRFVRTIATGETGWFSSPGLVDLNGDGRLEIVAPLYSTFVFDAKGRLLGKGTATKGRVYAPGVVADLDGDGVPEIVVGGNEGTVSAYEFRDGQLRLRHGWPASTCSGGQCPETRGMAAADLDGDRRVEIVATATSVLASPWYTNRQNGYVGRRLGWGQFIRWLSPTVEDDHYHRHVGPWPDVRSTMWLQWTASPPSVADLDGDGQNEVIGLPNAEMKVPYETQAYAFMVPDGAQGAGARSARRHQGFVTLPLSAKPAVRPDGDWYPPTGIPAPTVVDIGGDRRPEIVASVPDGFVYAVGPTGRRLWRHDYAHGAPKTFASEVVAADLNRDGTPELVLGTYALARGSGRLLVLSAAGKPLYDVRLPHQRTDGNGVGVPAAPSVGDLDGDGRLEIVLTTFDHGIDVFRVPGSGTSCLPWPTGRGNLLRNGAGPATVR
jgi:hypothetical protein